MKGAFQGENDFQTHR